MATPSPLGGGPPLHRTGAITGVGTPQPTVAPNPAKLKEDYLLELNRLHVEHRKIEDAPLDIGKIILVGLFTAGLGLIFWACASIMAAHDRQLGINEQADRVAGTMTQKQIKGENLSQTALIEEARLTKTFVEARTALEEAQKTKERGDKFLDDLEKHMTAFQNKKLTPEGMNFFQKYAGEIEDHYNIPKGTIANLFTEQSQRADWFIGRIRANEQYMRNVLNSIEGKAKQHFINAKLHLETQQKTMYKDEINDATIALQTEKTRLMNAVDVARGNLQKTNIAKADIEKKSNFIKDLQKHISRSDDELINFIRANPDQIEDLYSLHGKIRSNFMDVEQLGEEALKILDRIKQDKLILLQENLAQKSRRADAAVLQAQRAVNTAERELANHQQKMFQPKTSNPPTG